MDDSNKEIEKPQHGAGDIVHMGVKAILSALPFGGSAAEIFAYLVAPPLEKRRDEWIQSIIDGLNILESKFINFKIELAAKNEAFITALLLASRSAIATHEKETRLALRNAVLNSALPQAPDEIRQKMFIQWLDQLTGWHIKILRLFETRQFPMLELGESQWVKFGVQVKELATLIESVYPETSGQHTLYIQIIKDLHSMGLIANFSLSAPGMPIQIEDSPKLTPLGKDFLNFIKSPVD